MKTIMKRIIFFLVGFVLLTNLEINASPSSSGDFDNYNSSNSYSSYTPINTGSTTTGILYSDYKSNPTMGPLNEQAFNNINQQQSISGSYLSTTYNAPNYTNPQYMTPIQAYDAVKSLPDNYTGSVPVTVGGNVYSYQMDNGVLSSQVVLPAVQNNTAPSYNAYVNNSQNFVGPLRSEQMWNDSGKPVSEYALASNITAPSYNPLSGQNIQANTKENMFAGGYYVPSGNQAIVDNMVKSAPAGTFLNADSAIDTSKLKSTSIIQSASQAPNGGVSDYKDMSLKNMKFDMPVIQSYSMYVSDPFVVTNNDGRVYKAETWSKETPRGVETSTNYLGEVKNYDSKQTTFTKEAPLATGGGSPILTETWTMKTYEPIVNNQGNAMYTKIEVLKNEGATNDFSSLQPVPSYTVPTKNEYLVNQAIDSLIGPSQLSPQTSGGAVMQVKYDSPGSINSGVSNSIQSVIAPQIQPIAPANQDYRINQ